MQILKDIPPSPYTYPSATRSSLGRITVSFYEGWNISTWNMLTYLTKGNTFDALCIGIDNGLIGLRKIVKSPSGGRLRARKYHLVSVDIEENDTFELGSSGLRVPKTLKFYYSSTSFYEPSLGDQALSLGLAMADKARDLGYVDPEPEPELTLASLNERVEKLEGMLDV